MKSAEEALLKEFESGLKIVESVVRDRLSEEFNDQSIAINRLPFYHQKFACLCDEANSSLISVIQFLQLCIQRWNQEIQYQDEVLFLKEQIIEIFNKLCDGLEDDEVIATVRNNRQDVIEFLFKLCEFDQKQRAGDFCKGLMNGFEFETLNKFEDYAFDVLMKPFIAALPVGLIDYISKIFENDVAVVNHANVINATSKIMEFMKKCFESVLIKASEIRSNEALEAAIKNIIKKRKHIKVTVEQPINCKYILNRRRTKIEYIKLIMKVDSFLKRNISFAYEELELVFVGNESAIEGIIGKLPKTKKIVSKFQILLAIA